jgi:uncharacterized protein YybS (DUF2232 family)
MTADAAINRSPEEQIEIITTSFRCFHLSLAGLVPLIGLPFSILAIFVGARLRSRLAKQWNPAKHYLDWGMTWAAIGVFDHLLAAIALYVAIAENF